MNSGQGQRRIIKVPGDEKRLETVADGGLEIDTRVLQLKAKVGFKLWLIERPRGGHHGRPPLEGLQPQGKQLYHL